MSGTGDSDLAAEAFDQLRAEVLLLRRAVEGLAASQPEPPIDYAPTLAHLVRLLGSVSELVVELSKSPYLASSPASIAAEVEAIIQQTRREAQGELRQAIEGLGQATASVKFAVGQVRSRDHQRRWLAYAAGGGGALALLLWLLLSGPVIRALPRSWQVPERVAASTLGESRWYAGARMMQGARPEAWGRVALGEGLVRRNAVALDGCFKRARKAARSVICEVRIDPEDR